MKEFKVYVGSSEDHMTEALHAKLKDDNVAETFELRHTNKSSICFPSRFVKIVPISAHSHSFHTSIWFVSLAGINDEQFVEEISHNYEQYLETEALRHIFKHLRTHRLLAPYRSLMASTDLQVEHPLITRLYEAIVSEGDWAEAETAVQLAASTGLFDAYMRSTPPRAIWKRIYGSSADGDVPSRRGGHAMCIDEANGLIYLFGGWDGEKSLNDLWVYAIADDKWRLVAAESSGESAVPSPRSCHKMAFDPTTGVIYLLGGLSDSDGHPEDPANTSNEEASPSPAGAPAASRADFYQYHTRGTKAGSWQRLSDDTTASGGPPLVFDHQMVIDIQRQVLYVGGGRVNDSSSDNIRYSGLYAYDITSEEWELLQPRCTSSTSHPPILRRFGHTMLFEPNERVLFIFGGMEDGDKYLSDMYSYKIETNVASEVFSNFTASGGPNKTFTQRAVIDPALQEIYVFCGLTRTRPNPLPRLYGSNFVYRYDTRPGTWMKMLPEEPGHATPHEREVQQPRTRYAHQVVYDARTKTVYLHGGNAGRLLETGELDEGQSADDALAEHRLDDFWSMCLVRPGPDEIVRSARFQIRCQQFRELCDEVPAVQALKFLQTEVSNVVDHNTSEAETFRVLLSRLLTRDAKVPPARKQPSNGLKAPELGRRSVSEGGVGENSMRSEVDSKKVNMHQADDSERSQERTKVFRDLLDFFPANEKEPASDLVDMIHWYDESVED
ncbi:hypothetical protein FA95DRAFT_1537340 [Auriscalpium vulgare]|uniref:Uncharacterized protein n=1 Tax=Auriscalpium vulgare TaxID=40419 RepID=A0ACB8S041_9AGAM|nr:hypothetical protein FA95DRAFT_1537340 [Auriscalpium vulgare]